MKARVIVADPPWAFGDGLTMSDVKRGADSVYQGVLNVDALCALPVQSVADDNCVLALWFVSSQPEEGLRVMKAWGFDQKQIWTWAKLTSTTKPPPLGHLPRNTKYGDAKMHFGMGRLARNCTENLYIGTRGKVYGALRDKAQRNLFFAPATKHSTKPEALQDILDLMFPDPGMERLELFGRRNREGWTVIGNEAPDTLGEDVRVTLARLSA